MIVLVKKKPGEITDPVAHEPIPFQNYIQKPSIDSEPTHQQLESTSDVLVRECCQTSFAACNAEASSAIRSGSSATGDVSTVIPPAPCKLNSYLAANPGADVSQSLMTVDGRDKPDGPDGVECSIAY